MTRGFIGIITFLLFIYFSHAQEVPDLVSDIPPSDGLTSITTIEASFNNARRQEEMQLGLQANTMPNLDLPNQEVWDEFTLEMKMLFILNDEKKARNGISYVSNGRKNEKLLVPFQCFYSGMHDELNTMSQEHAQDMLDNEFLGHVGSDGRGTEDRLKDIDNLVGEISTLFAENFYFFQSSDPIDLIEQLVAAIYAWIYEDLIVQFKHRRIIFIPKTAGQHSSLSFVDDHQELENEGWVGFGYAMTPPEVFPNSISIVMNIADPLGSSNLSPTYDTGTINNKGCPDSKRLDGMITDHNGRHQFAGMFHLGTSIQISKPIDFIAEQGMQLSTGFQIENGSEAIFTIDPNVCLQF